MLQFFDPRNGETSLLLFTAGNVTKSKPEQRQTPKSLSTAASQAAAPLSRVQARAGRLTVQNETALSSGGKADRPGSSGLAGGSGSKAKRASHFVAQNSSSDDDSSSDSSSDDDQPIHPKR